MSRKTVSLIVTENLQGHLFHVLVTSRQEAYNNLEIALREFLGDNYRTATSKCGDPSSWKNDYPDGTDDICGNYSISWYIYEMEDYVAVRDYL